MRENANTFHHLGGAVLHQTIVCGNIRLAFSGIDNQRLYFIATATQFDTGREACAAQSGNTELMNTLDERVATPVAVVAPAVTLDPAIFTVGFNNDAEF